ncbi:MAG: response regulator [Flavobacterium sp.]|nr:response regulator [Flavobacterium sp.]
MNNGPIVLIDDDQENKEVLQSVLDNLNMTNELQYFETADEALVYLRNTTRKVLMIFSETTLPGKSGLALKMEIDSDPDLRKRAIPFVFWSTLIKQSQVNDAYTLMTVQGFFQKGNDYLKMVGQISTILDYWKESYAPQY